MLSVYLNIPVFDREKRRVYAAVAAVSLGETFTHKEKCRCLVRRAVRALAIVDYRPREVCTRWDDVTLPSSRREKRRMASCREANDVGPDNLFDIAAEAHH